MKTGCSNLKCLEYFELPDELFGKIGLIYCSRCGLKLKLNYGNDMLEVD
jgi:hypothetical protein